MSLYLEIIPLDVIKQQGDRKKGTLFEKEETLTKKNLIVKPEQISVMIIIFSVHGEIITKNKNCEGNRLQ